MRPSETNTEAGKRDDMQTETHHLVRYIVQRLADFIVRLHPSSHHRLRLTERLLPDDAIVALGEWRAGDLAVVTPYRTFGGDNVLAEDIQRSIEINGLGEVSTTSGDLIHGIRVCYCQEVLARRDDDEHVTPQLLVDTVLLRPSPVRDGEAAS